MDVSWELEQLGWIAAPGIVIEGRQLLYRVSDLLPHEDGSVEALVRGKSLSLKVRPSCPRLGIL